MTQNIFIVNGYNNITVIIMPEEQTEKFENKGQFVSVHDAILQTLDANINGKFFSKEAFEKNLSDWDGLPIVFAGEHLNMELFEKSPDEAVKLIRGEVVGKVQNPKIEITGHAKLLAQPIFNNRADELNKLIEEGRLSLSTGFYGVSVEDKLMSVKPNHLLVFVEDGNTIPADRGSGFLNAVKTLDGLLNQVKDLFNSKPDKEFKEEKNLPEGNEPTLEERIKALEAEYKEKIEVLNTELTTTKDELKTYKEAETARLAGIKNQQWNDIKAQIPIGQLKAEGAETKLREEFDKDPGAFTLKVLNMVKTTKEDDEEQGEEFKQTEKKISEDLESQRALEALWRI